MNGSLRRFVSIWKLAELALNFILFLMLSQPFANGFTNELSFVGP